MISIPKRPQWLLTGRGTWIGRLAQTPLISPKGIPDAARSLLRLSGMTAAALPSRKRGSPGFTLMEMVVVLAIVGILASIVAPLVITALTRAREATLQQDLKTMRKLIDDYYGDKGAFPSSLQVLVTQGYLRAIPRDPVNGNKAEWKTVLAKEGGVSDVRSLSIERGANGTPYADW